MTLIRNLLSTSRFPLLVAGLLLALTLAATVVMWAQLERERSAVFSRQARELERELEARVENAQYVLRSMASLFTMKRNISEVTAEDFSRYGSRLIPTNSNRMILHSAFMPKVTTYYRELYEGTSVTSVGVGETILPPGDRPLYFPITYVYPLTESSRGVVGFDDYSHPERRKALTRAIENGDIAGTSNVERINSATSATVMYLPLFEGELPTTTTERRRNLMGMVSVTMVTDHFFGNLQFDEKRNQVAYSVEDLTNVADSAKPFYTSAGFDAMSQLNAGRKYINENILTVGPLKWMIRIVPGSDYVSPVAAHWPLTTAIVGGLITIGAWLALARIQRGRREVRQSADLLTESDKQLQAANNQLQLLAQSSPVATIEWDRDGTILQWSRRAETLFHISSTKAIGQNFEELGLIVEEDLPVFRQARNQLLAGADTNEFSVRCRRDDGTVLHTEWFNGSVRDGDGSFIAFLSSVLDETARHAAERKIIKASHELEERVQIRTEELQNMNLRMRGEITDRQRTEAALRESQSRFETIIQCSPIGVCLIASDGKVLTSNRAFDQMVNRAGLARDSSGFFDYLSEAGHSFYKDMELLRQGNQSSVQGRFKLSGEAGAEIFVATALTLIRDAESSFYFVAHFVDETAQRRAQSELDTTNQALKESITQLEERNWRIQTMKDMADRLQICTSFEEARGTLIIYAMKWFEGVGGAISLYNQETQLLELYLSWNDTPGEVAITPVFMPNQCWALRRTRLHYRGLSTDELYCEHFVNGTSFESLCLPLNAEGQSLGALHLYRAMEEGGTGQINVERAENFGEHLVLIFANLMLRQKLHTQSVRDALTGLFNRRYLEESLDREIKRSERTGRPLSVCILDLDHFKSYNDRYGHDAGDAVLRTLATLLSTNSRGEDIPCRYGGEEFMLILPDASLEDAYEKGDHLRREVEKLSITFHGQVLGQFTMSAGVAEFPQHGSTRELLIKTADRALYRAKHSGRNRVITAEEVSEGSTSPQVME